MTFYYRFFFPLLLFASSLSVAQTVLSGKVTDAATGEPLSFVSVYYEGTPDGTFTDESGFYKLVSEAPRDSVVVSFFGYQTIKYPVRKNEVQIRDFRLYPEVEQLETIVLTNKEDPGVRIVKRAIREKDKNDKRAFTAYEYESFSTLIAGFDRIPENLKNRKMGKEIAAILDSISGQGDDKAKLPFFASEALSRVYVRSNPDKISEHIEATRISGVFVEDGSLISQLIGSSLQNYNFYQNWVQIVEKDFISPIAQGAMGYYDYRLADTLEYDGLPVYVIRVIPKRDQDLAFGGEIWIQDSSFALKRVDLTIGKEANLNYVGAIKIQQDLVPTEAGPWLPEFTDVYIRFTGLSEKWAGLEANYKSYNSDFILNRPKGASFYEEPVIVAEDAGGKEDIYWDQKRKVPLTSEERMMYQLIDSVKNVPSVKTFVEVVDIAVNGYYTRGKIDIGPYLFAYTWNEVEGSRFRLGARTNGSFSSKWVLSGFAAYGTRDNILKYGGQVSYIASRKRWTEGWIGYKYDIDQVAIPEEKLEDRNNLFLAFTRWGKLIGPTYNRSVYAGFKRQFTKDFSQKIIIRNKVYDPLFEYNITSDGKPLDTLGFGRLNTSEVILEARYARDEIFVRNDNQRISLGTRSWPIFRLRYTLGLGNVFNSDLSYQKLDFYLTDNYKVGALGRSYVDLNVGRIFSRVPLPLLEVHLGNESPFYTTAGFNLMNYFEFVSDAYVSLRYRHYFEGFILNRIPLIRKLKWRSLVSTGLVYGDLSNKNKVPVVPDAVGSQPIYFSSLRDKPYVEIGYGIENIFKIFRVDFFHRVTYLDNPGVRRFGVKFSVQFRL